MKLSPTEPDLATIHGRMKRGDLDLQPAFQRQEIWPDAKQRRLIDTILRDWHVPPVHVVELEDGRHEVLDGQQRLAAIRDFMDGKLRVDGQTEPLDSDIQSLHALKYKDLPEKFRRRFDRYALRVIILTDYSPEEPGELFFRLNQQSILTAPEQRNAFFGPARDQVKNLVSEAERQGLGKQTIGFSNSRMAYDDVVARFCEALEAGTLHRKITAAAVTDRYRSKHEFSGETITRAGDALKFLIHLLRLPSVDQRASLNKATCHSWLCFIAAAQRESSATLQNPELRSFLSRFESLRTELRHTERSTSRWSEFSSLDLQYGATALRIYNDRASSRVADVSSVLLRDYVTWLLFSSFAVRAGCEISIAQTRSDLLSKHEELLGLTVEGDSPEALGAILERSSWGAAL